MTWTESQRKCPVTWTNLSVPKELPPLVSLRVHITMDPSARVGSGWKDPIGPVLTNRRISEYQKLGLLGGRSDLVLPKPTGPRCLSCNSPTNVKHRFLSYLPRDGWYCELCVTNARDRRDREKNEAKEVQKRRRSYE